MGMFDYIDYKYNCEKCGEPLDRFQSKDSKCQLNTLKPEEVSYFYCSCNECGSWHDFEVERIFTLKNITINSLPSKVKLDKESKVC